MEILTTILLFVGWYVANFLTNTTSKETLKNDPAPIILTFVQMLVGGVGCFVALWSRKSSAQDVVSLTQAIIKAPTIKQLSPLVTVHIIGNLCTNYGILHGSIAFVQIVKATEPIFTILWGAFLMKDYPAPIKILSALPIVAGVILASYGESSTITYTLLFSMLSNVAFSFRNVAGKRVMLTSFQDPTTLFYGINLLGSIAILPFLLLEKDTMQVFNNGTLWSSGLFHFLYNWCSFLLLSRLHVLSHALGNVMKRAFIIILGVLLYHTNLNFSTAFGVLFCIGGSLLYNYVVNAMRTNDLSKNLKVFIYIFSAASVISVLFLFANTSAKVDTSISPESTSISTNIVNNINVPETITTTIDSDNEHFMIFWTRGEQQIPNRIEKCVESILHHQKNARITVYASFIESQPPLVDLVNEYPYQVFIKPIEVQTILKGTPLERWGRNHREWKWRSLTNFDYHVVDAIRFAALWKYGGVAMDADMMLLNPITQPFNFISNYFGDITTKVMKFEKKHPFILQCMEKFAASYDYMNRTANGPRVVQSLWSAFCNASSSTNSTTNTTTTSHTLSSSPCKNLKALRLVNAPSFILEEYFDFAGYEHSQHVDLLSSLSTSVALDTKYFANANTTISRNTFVDMLFSEYSIFKNDDHLKSYDLNLAMKFGTYVYDTINFGDEIQSIAHIQYLPRIDYFLERDHPMNYSHLPNITLIANGWYTWNPDWMLPPNIHPIFVAFHGSDRFPYNATKDFMNKHGPIGCRDLFTLNKFRAIGVNAYFSGCITTTLQNIRWDDPKEKKIYIVDPTLKHLLPSHVEGVQLINKTHVTWTRNKHRYFFKMELAMQHLHLYMVAQMVITTRIHCALPSLAFGTPVIFTKPNQKFFENLTDGMDPRWPGLIDLFTQFTINTSVKEAKAYPYANPPKNRDHNWMRRNIWAHLQKSPYIKESGRMFGVFRNLGV